MVSRRTIPTTGIWLAILTSGVMAVLGLDLVLVFGVLGVWVGSLFLVTSTPPENQTAIRNKRLSMSSMRELVENSSTPVLVTEKGNIAIANRSARKLLGTHIPGQDARVVFRQPAAIKLLGKKKGGQAIVRGLVRRQDVWRINRQVIDEDLAVIELINQNAEADISRAHTDFVANASHELRTPLASIIGYVETLSESGENFDTPMSQKFLGTIEREAKRMQALISDLMSLSRVEAEKHDLPETNLELASLVERAARDAAGSERSDWLEFELAEQPTVQGDQQQLEQLVRNLVDNAFKYGREGTYVRVRLDHSQLGEARITVSDTGDGIPSEHVPHLTRRFYRTDPSRSRASGGTGLGLAIVKHIVERHRGRLDIQSTEGVGTKVIVRLPQVESTQAGQLRPDA
ncbi:two-component sensor histidine kinase [Erythrobacter sp. SCSIO 43205]|uniref:ATP-binding protein n=1 Tax=Erythrobacter sp. SCSIO 43205 TaxID=2779361 RepID=UPI001CA83DEA|nr:ATP-binding protein [Erythrobacter sp. SCSIO 43205]UAB77047.1 two-component sensor histidine kinase [Erythrobacter sp. SCSIO 43205]